MKKISLFLALLVSLSFYSQNFKKEVFTYGNYMIDVPEGWKQTEDDGIINIFPTNEIGAITISEYHNLDLPKEEIKKFVLSLHHSQEEESKVKSNSSKKGYTQYNYEYFDAQLNLFWTTKVLHKDKDLYIISINCEKKYWNGNYMNLFNETFASFKLKK